MHRVSLDGKVEVLGKSSQGAGGEGDHKGVAVARGDSPCGGPEREAHAQGRARLHNPIRGSYKPFIGQKDLVATTIKQSE